MFYYLISDTISPQTMTTFCYIGITDRATLYWGARPHLTRLQIQHGSLSRLFISVARAHPLTLPPMRARGRRCADAEVVVPKIMRIRISLGNREEAFSLETRPPMQFLLRRVHTASPSDHHDLVQQERITSYPYRFRCPKSFPVPI